jgi:lipoate-protein ligase B
VWVDDKKICSIGLAFLHWVSRHGLAVNYSTPGNRIENLFCCGLDKGTTTSLEKLGYLLDKKGQSINRNVLEEAIISNLEKILNRTPSNIQEWHPENEQ